MSEHLIHINPQTKAVDMIDIRMYEELQTQYDRLSIANKQDEQTHREMWQEQEAKIEALKQENDKLKEALNECLNDLRLELGDRLYKHHYKRYNELIKDPD